MRPKRCHNGLPAEAYGREGKHVHVCKLCGFGPIHHPNCESDDVAYVTARNCKMTHAGTDTAEQSSHGA